MTLQRFFELQKAKEIGTRFVGAASDGGDVDYGFTGGFHDWVLEEIAKHRKAEADER